MHNDDKPFWAFFGITVFAAIAFWVTIIVIAVLVLKHNNLI
jgi:hypothetical protein